MSRHLFKRDRKKARRALKGKPCPKCGRRMKREPGAVCQFEGGQTPPIPEKFRVKKPWHRGAK